MKKYSFVLVLMLFVSSIMAQTIPSYVPKDGLVGWWPFNGNANDESGNGNNGIVLGASLTNDRYGNSNKAYNFNGLNNYISIKDNKTLQFTNSMSVSLWYNFDSLNFDPTNNILQGRLIDKVPNSTGQGYWSSLVKANSVNSPFYCDDIYSSNASISFGNKGGKITCTKNKKWYNLIYTFQNGLYRIYLNGLLVDSNSIAGNNIPSNNLDLYFGYAHNTNDPKYFYRGQLDDIAIYKRALSEQEIKQLHQGCVSEMASSYSFNSLLLTTGNSVVLNAVPQGGVFTGASIVNNQFVPSKAKVGLNKVQYAFKNSQGCTDSTVFAMIVADTVGNICKKYDTITRIDTVSVLKIKFKLTTGLQANKMASIAVYPNPTSDLLHIEVGDVKALDGYRYRIVDALGKDVYNELVKNTITEIPMKTLGAAGMYQFEVLDQKNVRIQTNKIVLQ